MEGRIPLPFSTFLFPRSSAHSCKIPFSQELFLRCVHTVIFINGKISGTVIEISGQGDVLPSLLQNASM